MERKERKKVLLDYRPRRLIGLGGLAGAGKSPLTRELIGRLVEWEYAFAEPIKKMGMAIERYARITPILEADKARVIPELGIDAQTLYQTLGDWGRGINSLFWVDLLAQRLNRERPESLVISDVRFAHEANFIRDNGGVCIRVLGTSARPCGGIVGHKSEDTFSIHFDGEVSLNDVVMNVIEYIKNILDATEGVACG